MRQEEWGRRCPNGPVRFNRSDAPVFSARVSVDTDPQRRFKRMVRRRTGREKSRSREVEIRNSEEFSVLTV